MLTLEQAKKLQQELKLAEETLNRQIVKCEQAGFEVKVEVFELQYCLPHKKIGINVTGSISPSKLK